MTKIFSTRLLFVVLILAAVHVRADGSIVGKIYHPYVQLLEKEVEFRTTYEDDSDKTRNGRFKHKLGYGQAISDQLFVEIYLSAVDEQGEALELESYEAELKWQLTEQGEYDNDWGLLFELEKERDEDLWEASTTLIVLREWPDWIATGNLSLIYEWGGDIDNEWETAFSGQLRYRHSARVEPGIEIYHSQGSRGIGPVVTGGWRLGSGRRLNWEFGGIWDTGSESADIIWKFNLEYEFQ